MKKHKRNPSEEQLALGREYRLARLTKRVQDGRAPKEVLDGLLSTFWLPPYKGVPYDEIPTQHLEWIFKYKFASPNTPDYKYVKRLLRERDIVEYGRPIERITRAEPGEGRPILRDSSENLAAQSRFAPNRASTFILDTPPPPWQD